MPNKIVATNYIYCHPEKIEFFEDDSELFDIDVEDDHSFLIEGGFVVHNSAGGSAKMGRNRRFQAILPLKGKVLNVEKKTLTQMLDNKEINSLIGAMGINVQTGDISKLRYHKIIITCDADVDGAHISTLILTLMYKYMRPLIDAGHVYLAQPPLYKVKYGKTELYLQDDIALDKWKKGKEPEKISIQRFKGLGEMNPDQLGDTTLDPKTRKLARVVITDEGETSKMFTVMMGAEVAPRKEFIMTNSRMIDESQIDA